MKRPIIITINIVLITVIAFLVFNQGSGNITGYAVADKKETVEKYLVSFNIKDIETGEVYSSINEKREIFFVPKKDKDFEKEKLVFVERKMISLDVDGNGTKCLPRNYSVTKHFYDKNGNEMMDYSEPTIYSSFVDSDRCGGAELPKADYELIFR